MRPPERTVAAARQAVNRILSDEAVAGQLTAAMAVDALGDDALVPLGAVKAAVNRNAHAIFDCGQSIAEVIDREARQQDSEAGDPR